MSFDRVMLEMVRPKGGGWLRDPTKVEHFYNDRNFRIHCVVHLNAQLSVYLGQHTENRMSRGSDVFSERIRLLRKERNLTQAGVAAQVGLSARGYQDLELGATPRGDTLLAIAEFYQVSIDWLMGRTDVRQVSR